MTSQPDLSQEHQMQFPRDVLLSMDPVLAIGEITGGIPHSVLYGQDPYDLRPLSNPEIEAAVQLPAALSITDPLHQQRLVARLHLAGCPTIS